MENKKTDGCSTIIAMILLSFPMAFWTDRSLEFWLTKLKIMLLGNTLISNVEIPFWLNWLFTALTLWYTLVANVVSEIIRYAL